MNTARAEIYDFESLRTERMSVHERTIRLGQLAIRMDQLGINDPLTHLFQRVEKGENANDGILEDLYTDIAERLPKTPFINNVNYEFTGKDFVSSKDSVSMAKMTQTNLRIFSEESMKNPDLVQEYERAKIEAEEVSKLSDWFKAAEIGSYMIFESLPIGQQKIAISRIYQKKSESTLQGSFVSLYNPSISLFNQFRSEMGGDLIARINELELLKNNYEFFNTKLIDSNEFINFYVGLYDHLKYKKTKERHSFGIEINTSRQKQNGVEKVRRQKKLASIYLETIDALAKSEGRVTSELMRINNVLDMNYKIELDQRISVDIARGILGDVINSITSVIDRADVKLLDSLEDSGGSRSANYAALQHFGNEAKTEGETYQSNSCPEYGRANTDNENSKTIFDDESEYNIISQAFGTREKLDKFGKPKIGVCRISNCPSRGELSWLPDKTLVGGCDICVCCHKHFAKGRSPEKIYKQVGQKNIKLRKAQKNKTRN